MSTRRAFLQASAAAGLTAFGVPALRAKDANETIQIGLIGCGGRCQHLVQSLVKIPKVHIAAVCDIWDVNLARAQKWGDGKQGVTKDYRALLDEKSIDAVLNECGKVSDIGCNHRASCRHRLKNREGQALSGRGQDQHIRSRINRAYLAPFDVPLAHDHFAQVPPFDLGLNFMTQRSVAHHDRLDWSMLRQLGDAGQELERTLLFGEPADEGDDKH